MFFPILGRSRMTWWQMLLRLPATVSWQAPSSAMFIVSWPAPSFPRLLRSRGASS